MKITKKRSVFLIVFVMIIMQTLVINAEENDGQYDDRFDSYEQYENAPDYYSEESQNIINSKISESEAFLKNLNLQQRAAVRFTMPGYLQDNSYYCGPASVQNVVKFLTGTYYSQGTLASDLATTTSGTYVYKVAEVLRAKTGANYEYTLNSQYNYWNAMISATNGGYPVVYNVLTSALSSAYPFASGHYIVGTGYATDNYIIYSCYYFDPYYLSGVSGARAVNKDQMNNAINQNGGYYIW